jgi:peptide/nickel transport system substrate-binding protein
MRRTLFGGLVLACALVAACDTGPGLRRRRDPGTLVVARATDVQMLDPARVLDIESIEIGTLLYEGLVRWEPGTTNIEPGLARSWQSSPDGRVWTFQLRRGLVFHDGTALDAEAVAFSFGRVLDAMHPGNPGPSTEYWRSLLTDIRRVTALDATTVEIRTIRPYAPLLSYLAIFPIVSPTAVLKWGDAFKEHPVGAGPFRLERWDRGEALALRRFEHYWGEPPVLDRIVFRVIVDARQRLIELESGSVDLAMSILPDEQSFVELHPDLELHTKASNDVSYLAFNMTRRPFDELVVRQAASHAVNKTPIVKLAYQGRAHAAESALPPGLWGRHVSPQPRYPYDPARARALLEQAIASHVFDPELTYKLYAPSTPRPYMTSPERVARLLQAALDNVGIKTELRLLPHRQFRQAVQAGEHDLAVSGWLGDTADPDNFLYVLFHSDNALPGSAHNISFFRDQPIDRMLADARGVTDQAGRALIYRAAQERIAELAPWVPIAHSDYVVAVRKEIVNVVLSPLGHPVYSKLAREGHR